MKQTIIDKVAIATAFNKASTKEDLLNALDVANIEQYGEETTPLRIRSLTYYANPQLSGERYNSFTIKKKSGEPRTIMVPCKPLKNLLKSVNLILNSVYQPHGSAHGFVAGRSIVSNAREHVNMNYVYNIDLKDFFSTIDQARFWKRLQFPPFNLKEDRTKLANILAPLCFHEMEVERKNEKGEWKLVSKNVLPQGAPTSPTISNIICERMDRRLKGVANRFGANYTRYADDITFSSSHYLYAKNGEFLTEIRRIISDQGFHINANKTRLQRKHVRQEVTGVVVNTKTNVRKSFIKKLRMWVYYWEKYGYEKAEKIYFKSLTTTPKVCETKDDRLVKMILGKLAYLGMTAGKGSSSYLNLKTRINILLKNRERTKIPSKNTRVVTLIKDPAKHKPKKLSEFLEIFQSIESKGLKYLTHLYDKGEFNGHEILHSAKDEFTRLAGQFDIPASLWMKINQFAFNSSPEWYYHQVTKDGSIRKKNIQLGWSGPTLTEWMSEHPGVHPIEKWEHELIQPFKDCIQIRKPRLLSIFELLVQGIFGINSKFAFEYQDLVRAQFYTDVDTFQWAINSILKTIRDNSTSDEPKIIIGYSSGIEGPYRTRLIDIMDAGSYMLCNPELGYADWFGGDLNSVKHNLIGLCDWSIEAPFKYNGERKYWRVSILTCNDEEDKEISEPPLSGVRHRLKIYA